MFCLPDMHFLTRKKSLRKLLPVGLLTLTACWSLLAFHSSAGRSATDPDVPMPQQQYAVFGCATPTDRHSYRGFDDAFYLPLTALAWRRIGFRSLVLISGSRSEWLSDPALSFVLDSLGQVKAHVIFADAPYENRAVLSQTARLFAAYFRQFPGRDHDFLLTTDADLWPLHRQHYLPAAGRPLVLVHGKPCCGQFKYNGRRMRLLPVSHVGASAETWRDIVKFQAPASGSSLSAAIMRFFEVMFDGQVWKRVYHASPEWFYDQKFISVKLDDWMRIEANNQSVREVTVDGMTRLDRHQWNPNELSEDQFQRTFNAHLLFNGSQPDQWKRILPLVRLMYRPQSMKTKWVEQYAEYFSQILDFS